MDRARSEELNWCTVVNCVSDRDAFRKQLWYGPVARER
jgi:hypothetical protein